MKPYDAVFISIALGSFLERPRYWWVAAVVPLIAFVAHWLPIGHYAIPIAAIAAFWLVPRYAPVAIIMAIPDYSGPSEVVKITCLWLAASLLILGLENQIEGEVLTSWTRRMAAQLLSVAVLYYTLLPVTFL